MTTKSPTERSVQSLVARRQSSILINNEVSTRRPTEYEHDTGRLITVAANRSSETILGRTLKAPSATKLKRRGTKIAQLDGLRNVGDLLDASEFLLHTIL